MVGALDLQLVSEVWQFFGTEFLHCGDCKLHILSELNAILGYPVVTDSEYEKPT